MNDRDIEDTRQPPDPPTHAECDRCGWSFYVDDLVMVKSGEWLCFDCRDKYCLESDDED